MKQFDRYASEKLIARGLVFLRALSRRPRIRAGLMTRGYGPASHREGWALWKTLVGAKWEAEDGNIPALDPVVSLAMAEIDAWDEPNFMVAEAALKHAFPKQSAFVFDDLKPARGPQSLATVTRLLDRLDALDSGQGRPQDQRDADRKALDRLAERGITAQERLRVRDLLKVIQAWNEGQAPDEGDGPVEIDADAEARQEDLWAFNVWLEEWSQIARATFKRRDYLVALGLAKRRKPSKQDEPAEDTSEDAP